MSKLSSLSTLWKKVTPTAAGFVQIPDGDYVGDLKEMKMEESKASGRLQVVSSYVILDEGDCEGKTVKRFDGLDNETSMGFFKGVCEVIGFEVPEDLELLQEAMDAFVADSNRMDLYKLTMKTSKGKDGKTYSNLFVNGISDYTKGDGTEETVEGEVIEEEVEVEEGEVEGEVEGEIVEEVVEEVQEIQPPLKKFARVVTKPVAQVAKQVAKPVVKLAAKPVVQLHTVTAKPVVGGVRKIIAKR